MDFIELLNTIANIIHENEGNPELGSQLLKELIMPLTLQTTTHKAGHLIQVLFAIILHQDRETGLAILNALEYRVNCTIEMPNGVFIYQKVSLN